MKKAIGYTSDIILGRTGEVISRKCQAELISQYAVENGIEIVAWMEDEMYNEDVLMRPGIQELLAFDQPYDMVLCERVWALSRSMAVLEPFFKELDRRKVGFESATTMWDCVSQRCRRRFSPTLKELAPALPAPVVARSEVHRIHVSRPNRLRFAHLLHHAHPRLT
jgi:hypothetical protein